MKKTNTGNHDANKHVKNDLEINLPDKWRMASLRLCVFVSFFLACPLRMSRAQSVGLHEWTSSVVICEISLTRAREMCAHNYDNNNSPQCKMIIALESDKTPSMMLLLLLLSFFLYYLTNFSLEVHGICLAHWYLMHCPIMDLMRTIFVCFSQFVL